LRPSAVHWWDQAIGKSISRLDPNPRGRRPSIAAATTGGATKASDNVIRIERSLLRSRPAILPLIAKHGGSIINIAGDGVVAQFPSAVRAVECAVAMQKIMAERNFDVPTERRMLLRIGVNLGDIIHDGTRTYGDGINVAARLEPLAEPGGICISANVRDAIFGKLGLPLRDIGEKTLKNIDRPVHIFQIQAPGARARRDWLGAGLRHYRRLAPALGLIVLLAALAGFGAWRLWPRATGRPEYTPVIAVLPFTNASGDKSLDNLSPSIAREVSSMLSTYPIVRMVQPSAPPPQGADIGRRYTLEGDIAKSGEALEALKGEEATHPWPLMMIYAELGRLDEAKAAGAEWAKAGFHSILAETCLPVREPMKQKYLDDLRKVGVPERAERASP
jgi:hypothetical protein